MPKKVNSKEPTFPMDGLLEAMQAAKYTSMLGFGADWIESMTDMGSEMLSFIAARVEQDVQTQSALLQAEGVAEVQNIQAQFFQKAMDDYAAEAGKLMKIGQAVSAGGAPASKPLT